MQHIRDGCAVFFRCNAGCRHSGGFFDIEQGKRQKFTFQHGKAAGKTIFFNKMIHFCIIISFTDKIV